MTHALRVEHSPDTFIHQAATNWFEHHHEELCSRAVACFCRATPDRREEAAVLDTHLRLALGYGSTRSSTGTLAMVAVLIQITRRRNSISWGSLSELLASRIGLGETPRNVSDA